MEEQWKLVDGFPNYEVSSFGNIRSLNYNHTGCPRLLKFGKTVAGYLKVILWNQNGKTDKLVHRLVAEAFIPNPEALDTVNHKDEDKTNNKINNLEWCSRLYNNQYGTKGERTSIGLTDNPLITKPVYQLDRNGNIINEYSSITRAAEAIGCRKSDISRICCGNSYRHTAHGYGWRFK